jgi:N-acetylneuraminic acid mutarotase
MWLNIVPVEGQPQAFLYFGEGPEDVAYHLPEPLAEARIWRRTSDGRREALVSEKVETDDHIGLMAPLPDGKPCVLESAQQYGLYEDWLLTYYAKHVHAASNDQLAAAGPSKELKLDIVPRAVAPSDSAADKQSDSLELTVLWDGKPLADAKVDIAVGDADAVEMQTDENGKITIQPAGGGLVAVLANYRDPSAAGELDGKKYSVAAHYITLTFPWQGAKIASIPSAGEGAATTPPLPNASSTPPLPDAVASFGAAVVDGWLYVYGGHTGKAHDHSAENLSKHFRRVRLDGGREWEELPMQAPLQGLPLVAYDGKLYRVGGMNARNATADDEEDLHSTAEFASFDPASGKWTELAPLPAPRSSHDAVVIGDKLYVVGGWTLEGPSEGQWLRQALVYDLADPDAGWQALPEQPFRRRALAAGEWQGKLVVLGGMNEEGDMSQQVDLFDPKTGKWSQGPDLTGKGILNFGVAAWNLDGELYVSGMEGVVYRLSDEGSAWEEAARLAKPRFFHRLLPGGDDALLAVAGASRKGHLDDVEQVEVGAERQRPRTDGSVEVLRGGPALAVREVAPHHRQDRDNNDP